MNASCYNFTEMFCTNSQKNLILTLSDLFELQSSSLSDGQWAAKLCECYNSLEIRCIMFSLCRDVLHIQLLVGIRGLYIIDVHFCINKAETIMVLCLSSVS